MNAPDTIDLTELRARWDEQRTRMRAILARIESKGLTRPARDPEERAWLVARGETGFIENETSGQLARAYYQRRYTRIDAEPIR